MANIKISELSNAGTLNGTEVLPIVQGNATVKTTTQNIANLLGISYTPENVANKDTDTTLSANSDTKYPSQKAVKTYVDSTVVSAITDNGNWDASGNLFPNVNAQGQPIQKGDLWYISVAGTLGGSSVLPGYSIRALVNNPAQNATNWGIINVGYGFTPENVSNKSADTSLGTSNTLYPTQNAVKTYVTNALSSVSAPNLQAVTTAGATTSSNIQVGQVTTTVGSSLQSSGDLLAKNIILRPSLGNTSNQLALDASGITGTRTYTLPNATGTIALLSSISATSPLSYNSGTGTISIAQASTSQSGYLSSTDWNTFNSKQTSSNNLSSLSSLSYSSASFVKMTASGTFSLDKNTYVSSSALSNYLPLGGGTMSGSIIYSVNAYDYTSYSINGVLLQQLQPSSPPYKAISLIAEGYNSELGYMQAPDGGGGYTPSLKMETNGVTPRVTISNWGFQFPRLNYTQIQSIQGDFLQPGLMVYQTDAGIGGEGLYVRKSGGWYKISEIAP